MRVFAGEEFRHRKVRCRWELEGAGGQPPRMVTQQSDEVIQMVNTRKRFLVWARRESKQHKHLHDIYILTTSYM